MIHNKNPFFKLIILQAYLTITHFSTFVKGGENNSRKSPAVFHTAGDSCKIIQKQW